MIIADYSRVSSLYPHAVTYIVRNASTHHKLKQLEQKVKQTTTAHSLKIQSFVFNGFLSFSLTLSISESEKDTAHKLSIHAYQHLEIEQRQTL